MIQKSIFALQVTHFLFYIATLEALQQIMIIYSQIQLRESNHSFFVISLNETKIKVDHEQLLNTEISQLSLSNAGGVGFFVLDHLNFIIINDFPTSNEDYESL